MRRTAYRSGRRAAVGVPAKGFGFVLRLNRKRTKRRLGKRRTIGRSAYAYKFWRRR